MPPKKSAAPALTADDFKIGDTVTAKVKGYPEWPGKVRRVVFNKRFKRA